MGKGHRRGWKKQEVKEWERGMRRVTIKRRRDVAIVLITVALGLGVNFIFQKVEVAAILWFVALIFLLDLLFTSELLRNLPNRARLTLAAELFVAISSVSLWFIWPLYQAQHSALLDGDLFGAETYPYHNPVVPQVKIGDSKTVIIAAPQKEPIPYFQPFPDAAFLVELGREGPLVTTTVRDRNGNVVVDVNRNHWTVYPPYCLDKNYSTRALEVRNSSGHVVLQLELTIKPFPQVQVQGEWWSNEDRGLRILGEGGHGEVVPLSPQNQHLGELINDMFQYPSKYHLGKLRGEKPSKWSSWIYRLWEFRLFLYT
jgi:hypothetical protein